MGFLGRLFDSTIATLSPQTGVRRAHARNWLTRFGGGYDAAKNSETYRLMKANRGTANSVLEADLATLQARCRHAYRNFPAAKACIEARVGVVVATGIDVEPNTGSEKDDIALKEMWEMFCTQVDASGQLHFKEIRRQAFRCESLNGAYLFQIVMIDDPERLVPFALHAIEADQLSPYPVHAVASDHAFSNGVESDKYGRPVWYHIMDHPSDSTAFSGKSLQLGGVRIAADEIIHGFEKLRPGQSTGDPILVAALQRMVQEEELVAAELQSAIIGSSFSVALMSELQEGGGNSGFGALEAEGETGTDDVGNELTKLESGTIARLNPGDDLKVIANNRPSQAIAPFRNMLRGDIAASAQVSRVDLDKNYSEANYSSMRADMLDKKRLLTPVQIRFGKALVSRVYTAVLPMLALKSGVSLAKKGTLARMRQENHTLVPDGWAYVDPEKDIKASLLAIEGGISTYRDEIGQRGGNYREIHAQLAKEFNTPVIQHIAAVYRAKNTPLQNVQEVVDANATK